MAKKIMVVDDEPDIRESVKLILEKEGYSVVTAISGDDALKKIKSGEKPVLILMDIIMPGLQAKDIITRLAPIKVVYFSVLRTSEAEKDGFFQSSNVVGFIQKPFDIKELIRSVKECLSCKL